MLAAAALGQAGVAAADDTATPTPSPTPSPAGRRRNGHTHRCRDDTGNTAPVAVDDRAASVVAGGKVTVKVLANDTDDGLGRPAGEPRTWRSRPSAPDRGRPGHRRHPQTLTVTTRATDAGAPCGSPTPHRR